MLNELGTDDVLDSRSGSSRSLRYRFAEFVDEPQISAFFTRRKYCSTFCNVSVTRGKA
jgi:hypothetical protein